MTVRRIDLFINDLRVNPSQVHTAGRSSRGLCRDDAMGGYVYEPAEWFVGEIHKR